MKDQSKTKTVLIQELVSLRQRISELERSESRRRKLEEKLRESEERFRNLYEKAPLPYQSLDEDGRLLRVNQTWLDTLGYRREDILGRNFSELLHPDRVAHFAENFPKFKASGEIWGIEFEMVKKDGSTILVSFNGKISRDSQERFAQTHCIFYDITELKKTQKALQESEEYFRAITENATDIVLVVDKKGAITYASPSVEHILGYQQEEMVGKISLDLIVSEDLPRAVHDFGKAIRTEGVLIPNGFRVRHKDGSERVLEGVGRNLFDNPAVAGFIMNVRDVTDSRKAEEALRESEERFRTLIELTPDIVYRVDQKGMFTYVNPMLEKVTGYPSSELKELPFTTIIAPEFRASMIDHFRKGMMGSEAPPYECDVISRDGTRTPVEFLARTLYDKDGRPAGRFGIGRDITERRRLEQNLIASEKKYRNLVDNTLVGVYQTTLEGRILYANRAFADMFGYGSPEELMSANVVSLYKDKEDRNRFLEAIGKERKLLNYDLRLVTKDGKDRDIILSGMLDGGSILGTLVDITERKQAEESLRAAEELYRTLANRSQIAIYIVQDKKIVFANPHLSEYSGYGPDDLTGKDIAGFVYPDDRDMVRQQAARMLKGESSMPYEYRIIDKRGRIRWLVETVAPITFHGRRATLGSTMDITEHKHMEKQLQDTRDQLVRSEKLASTGLLASGAAHEILNPLNILSLKVQMMEIKPPSEDDLKNSLETCKNQIKRIARIVDGMRIFSRIPEKKLAERNISEIMDHVLALSAPRIKAEGITMEVHYDPGIPLLRMDEAAMERVLSNLLSNALDAMTGRERKWLRVLTGKKENNALIAISDTGHGIREEDLSRLFDPFFTTKGPDKGSGLGLSVSYGIVKEHGGRIWAENNEWGGATFFIELPLEENAAS